jgi:NAD(P)H dehydrogenase (quinone)
MIRGGNDSSHSKRTVDTKKHEAKLNLQRPFSYLRKRALYYKENTTMAIDEENKSRPRVLILGSTGRTGSKVITELERIKNVQVVYASRKLDQVEAWQRDGKDAVLLDLDQPKTFPDALTGIDRLFLVTGYSVAMVHQSKTIVDAAADAGVKFIVHLGIHGNGRLTYAYATWHEMVERYIEGSGVAWAHLHPYYFMDNLLAAAPVVGGRFYWFMGEQAVGWIAPEDVAAVAAKILADGPEHHSGKQYWLATEMLNGTQAATEIAKGLDIPVEAVVLTPDDLVAQVTSGGMKMPAYVEATYGASILEWVRQTYEGRLKFGGSTSVVEDLTGNKPQTLERWVRANREAVLSAAS